MGLTLCTLRAHAGSIAPASVSSTHTLGNHIALWLVPGAQGAKGPAGQHVGVMSQQHLGHMLAMAVQLLPPLLVPYSRLLLVSQGLLLSQCLL